MISKALFSSNSDEWATPQALFDELNEEFHFTLDVCATAENTKCKEYLTKEDNGLLVDWKKHVCWMNPPYSNIAEWIWKAATENIKGATVVCLIPSRTDTKYFHNFIWNTAANRPYDGVEIRFIKGRLKFQMENKILSELKEVLEYYPDEGIFKWKVDIFTGKGIGRKLISKGDIAGFTDHTGYRYIKYKSKKYSEHRLAYLFVFGTSPKFVDHKDGNKSNNKISNLRECTRNQNGQNRPKTSTNTSGYKGVSWHKRDEVWTAQIGINGTLIHLGYFNNAEDAARAYDNRALEEFGEFAKLNFEVETKDYGDSKNSAPFPSMIVVFR